MSAHIILVLYMANNLTTHYAENILSLWRKLQKKKKSRIQKKKIKKNLISSKKNPLRFLIAIYKNYNIKVLEKRWKFHHLIQNFS